MSATEASPGRERVVYTRLGRVELLTGKVVYVGGRWIFRRDLKPDNLMRFCDGFAIDAAVLERLLADVVDELHYTYEGRLYAVTPERMREKAIRRRMAGRDQYILPRSSWSVGPVGYTTDHIPATRRETVDL